MAKKKIKVADLPWKPCTTWEPADASAIQSLFRGDATEAQQKRAINFIVTEVCTHGYHGEDPEHPSNNSYANGKRYVGHFILMLMRLNVSQFTKETTE